jgi:hypothetical protein
MHKTSKDFKDAILNHIKAVYEVLFRLLRIHEEHFETMIGEVRSELSEDEPSDYIIF